MKTPKSSLTGDAGVGLVQFLVNHQLGWLFRSQPEADKGIDAHLEIVDNEHATGRLVALQIKSGTSWFSEATTTGFVFRPETRHVEYWLGHSLPVAVVLADVGKQVAYWQIVTDETVGSAGKGWKMTIPSANTLSMPAASALAAASEGDAYTLKLRQLQLARPWMEYLVNGGALTAEVEEWVNKSSGRASLRLQALDESGTIAASHEWPHIVLPGADYAAELPRMFPWAILSRDAESDAAGVEAGQDQHHSAGTISDQQDERHLGVSAVDEWQDELRLGPAWSDGEVDHWRLHLGLSDVGRAFLTLDEHLSNEFIHHLFRR